MCAFVITFGTLSRSSSAVVETGVCVHHRPTGGLAFNGRVQFSWIVRRKQIRDFVHIVEVSDSARDRLQGLHHCFFGWRTSSSLQLLEVCEPLSRAQDVGLLRRVSTEPQPVPELSSQVLSQTLGLITFAPRPQPDREPVLPRFGWRQTSRFCRSWHSREFDPRNVWLAGSCQHSSQEFRRRVFRLGCDLSLFFGQQWNCRVCLESQL